MPDDSERGGARIYTPLHRRRELLVFVADHIAATGVAPSYREIAAHFGWSSASTVAALIDRLERDGHLRRTPGRHRSLEVLRLPALPAGDPLVRAARAVVELRHLSAGRLHERIGALHAALDPDGGA